MDNNKFQELVLQQFQAITSELKNLKDGQQKLESKVDKLELRMEDEVIEKIRDLYDDRSVNQDYFASIRKSQSRIEEDLKVLVYKSMNQDQKLDERELRLLRIEK